MRTSLACFTVIFCFICAAPAQTATNYVEGEVIVTFKNLQDDDAVKTILGRHSLAWGRHYDWLSRRVGKHLGVVRDKHRSTKALIAELSKEPGVESVDPNYIRHVLGAIPNDTFFPQLWALRNTGQIVNGATGTPGADIKFPAAWALARPSTNPVVVAVIDTGVDLNHPDIATNLWVNPGEIAGNGFDDDGNGFVDDVHGYDFADNTSSPQDSGFHGSHVSGTIAAIGNNQQGVIGVNFQAKIMALKASNDGENIGSSAEIEALQYAAMMKSRGVNLVAINASFGGGGSSSAEITALNAVGAAGIIFCAAAGNASLNHDVTPSYPASYRLPNMIVVAATDQNDALASFSDFGATTVDIGAPGVNILSIAPVSQQITTSINCFVQQASNTYAAAVLTFAGSTTGISGTIYDCGIGNPTNFPAAVSNNIALIQRGTLNFNTKVDNAMHAGATAAIIFNNVSGNFLGTLQYASNWIPAVSISLTDGQALQKVLPTNGIVVNTAVSNYQFLDGTSMATPHVVGAVAFAAMNFPNENVTQRIARVLTNADVVPGLVGLVHGGARLNLQRIVDTDTNGLPDWWELQFFGQLTGTNPNADPDHDGMSNLGEFLAGTNPTNASSNLRLITSNTSVSNNNFVVKWPSVSGITYRLLRSTNLTSGFNIVATNIIATPPTNTYLDTISSKTGPVLYRLQIER